jgi:hypothetical protein
MQQIHILRREPGEQEIQERTDETGCMFRENVPVDIQKIIPIQRRTGSSIL